MPQPLFADLHCHPSFKPYARNFPPDPAHPAPGPADVTSLWHGSSEHDFNEQVSDRLGVAMYTQSHFAAAAKGGLQVIGMSIGALEQEFITISKPIPAAINKILSLIPGVNLQDALLNLVTRFGRQRLDSVRNAKAYFPDLLNELAFIRAQENKVFLLEGLYYTFCIAESGAQVVAVLAANAAVGAGSSAAAPVKLCIVLSIEGLHNLDARHGKTEAEVLAHAQTLKSAAAGPLFFVTLCHHFWNGLCGHAPSLPGLLKNVFDQSAHWKEGFHALGLKVVMQLLDKTQGRRVLIDVKHMSFKARTQYFNLLGGTYPTDLDVDPATEAAVKAFFRFNFNPGAINPPPPVIASHAAANGYNNEKDKKYHGNYPYHAAGGVESPFENKEIYEDPSINFYDADLISIMRFNGLIGIQLDAHRIAGPAGLDVAKAQQYPHAFLVWNQVLHMVELWDKLNFDHAWDRICIGSDFDGIICPMQEMHRASDFPHLYEGLLYYCKRYFMSTASFEAVQPGMGQRGIVANRYQQSATTAGHTRLNAAGANAPEQTGLSPEAIVTKLCSGNMLAFMKEHFV